MGAGDAARDPPRVPEHDLALAGRILGEFAERTGLGSERPARRYLWTDAFAVCNALGLARATGEERYARLALALVDQVHHVLGRHRPDDPRHGWISGLSESEGERHPTRGGLRIGKDLPERPADAPFDERLEWERDGQYFHYLTRWMHALDQTARATGRAHLSVWARELCDVAQRAFTREEPGGAGRRMLWKMSIDLSRPLVPSMGQHDPLDGFVTSVQLRATAASLAGDPPEPDLARALAGFASLVDVRRLATADPLGLGGLLSDAARVAQLLHRPPLADGILLEALLASARAGLSHYASPPFLRQPASHRLAFRELGLAIGLRGLPLVDAALEAKGRDLPGYARMRALLEALAAHADLGAAIASFWRVPDRRRERAWTEHGDINDVMLGTCLAPEGALWLHPARQAGSRAGGS